MQAQRASRRSRRSRAEPSLKARGVAGRLAGVLRPAAASRPGRSLELRDPSSGQSFPLTKELMDVMAVAAQFIAEGRDVTVLPNEEMLSTQQAADRLNVSRQYLVRLVDRGDLPSIKVGTHRRLGANGVEAYKKQRDAARDGALDELAAISEELGGYGLDR